MIILVVASTWQWTFRIRRRPCLVPTFNRAGCYRPCCTRHRNRFAERNGWEGLSSIFTIAFMEITIPGSCCCCFYIV